MNELTLESLAKRVEALEQKLLSADAKPKTLDWESVAGMFEGDETMRQIIAEGAAIREAERNGASKR